MAHVPSEVVRYTGQRRAEVGGWGGYLPDNMTATKRKREGTPWICEGRTRQMGGRVPSETLNGSMHGLLIIWQGCWVVGQSLEG